MTEERKYLSGELNYTEGKTTIANFLSTISRELISQNWIAYNKNETDHAWSFDLRREIWLPSAFTPANIRLYKAILQSDNSYKKGDLISTDAYMIVNNIIRGIKDTDDGTNVGDRVLVEVCYEATEFQQVTFLENTLPYGDRETFAVLKSRPQGDIKIYKDTVQVITGEELYQEGGNEFYKFAKYPVSQTKGSHKVKIYRNGVVVDESEYVIDYFNGVVLFNQLQQSSDVITADYGFCTGTRGEEIPTEKFKRYQERLIDTTPTRELTNLDIIVDADYYWNLHYPERHEDIEDRVVMKTQVDISSAGDRQKLKTYYVEMRYVDHLDNSSVKYRTGVEVRFGATLDSSDDTTLDDELSSEWAKMAWYREQGFENGIVFKDWLPIRYWMNFTKEYCNLVIQGDPSADIHPYNNYIIGYAYFGMLKSYDSMENEDLENNFGMTVSSDIIPEAEDEFATTWGVKTGTGITDIVMERTGSNIPYQAHYASFHTTPEFMDKHFITASEFTGSHHFSEVTVVHGYERERGKLQGMLIGDRSSIFHLDELISDKDRFDFRGALVNGEEVRNEYGFPFASKEKRWVQFNINAPYWFASNSPNVFFGVALRKS